MRPIVLILWIVLLMTLTACGGGDDDDLNAGVEPADSGQLEASDIDASGVRPPTGDDVSDGDDIFGSDTEGAAGAAFEDADGELFEPESGVGATGD